MNRRANPCMHVTILALLSLVATALLAACGSGASTYQGPSVSVYPPPTTGTYYFPTATPPPPPPTHTPVPPPPPPPPPTHTPVPPPPTPTPTPTPAPTPTNTVPPPLASASVSNIDAVRDRFGDCYVSATVTNTSGVTGYQMSGTALVDNANGLVTGAQYSMYGSYTNLSPGGVDTYQGRISIVNQTNTPIYVTVTIKQTGQVIGSGTTRPFAIACH